MQTRTLFSTHFLYVLVAVLFMVNLRGSCSASAVVAVAAANDSPIDASAHTARHIHPSSNGDDTDNPDAPGSVPFWAASRTGYFGNATEKKIKIENNPAYLSCDVYCSGECCPLDGEVCVHMHGRSKVEKWHGVKKWRTCCFQGEVADRDGYCCKPDNLENNYCKTLD